MSIMSIDPGLNSPGVCIYDGRTVELFTILNSTLKEEYKKYIATYRILVDYIEKYNVRHVLVEDYAFSQKGSSSVSKLAQIKGMVIAMCVEKQITYTVIPISTWKSITGYVLPKGKSKNQEKIDYIKTAKKIYDYDYGSCDEVDALFIMAAVNIICNNSIVRSEYNEMFEDFREKGIAQMMVGHRL